MLRFFTDDSAKPSSAWDLSGDDSDEDDFSALTAMIDARDDSLKGKAEVVSRSGGGGDSTSTPPPAGQVLPPPVGSTVGHVLGDKVRCSPHPSPGRRALIGQEVLLAEVYESECSASLSTHSNHIDSLFQKYMDETITNGEEDPQIISLLQQQQSKMHAKKKASGVSSRCVAVQLIIYLRRNSLTMKTAMTNLKIRTMRNSTTV